METKTLITHNGKFHIDEVFSYGILSTIFYNSNFIRTRDEFVIEKGINDENSILFDLGKNYDSTKNVFDHHFESESLLTGDKIQLTMLEYRKILTKYILGIKNIFNNLNEKISKENKKNITSEQYLRDFYQKDITFIKKELKIKIDIDLIKNNFQNQIQYRKYSSLGLIWKHYGLKYIELKLKKIDRLNAMTIWEEIDKKVIKKIDGIDNGYLKSTIVGIASLIDLYNNEDVNDSEKQKVNFIKASKILIDYLDNLIDKERILIENQENLKLEYKEGKRIQIFSKYLSGMDKYITGKEEDVSEYIVYPNLNKWRLKTINIGNNNSKILLPENWLIEPPKGCEFVHTALFISEFDTLENIINALGNKDI